MKKLYVVGFLFSEDLKRVVLIHKTKPDWQVGFLNGVGGKVEQNEMPLYAMRREFQEETGLDLDAWKPYANLEGDDWVVYFFNNVSKYIDKVQTTTKEKVEIFNVEDINTLPVIPNLKWLIPMCFDKDIKHGIVRCW